MKLHPTYRLAVSITTELRSSLYKLRAINEGGDRIKAELKEIRARQLGRARSATSLANLEEQAH